NPPAIMPCWSLPPSCVRMPPYEVRMNGDYDPLDSPAVRRGSWFGPLILPLVAFLLGLGAMGYILARWDAAARVVGVQPAPPPATRWPAIQAELGALITVRRRDTPSPEPEERLRRATQRLDAGQVDVALAEVSRIPGNATASDWIRKARLYVAARAALDTIET